MNLPSFPIPNPKPDYGVAAQRVQALQDVLGYVVQTMAGGVDAGMSAIQQDLDAATRTLMRSANGRVNGLARQVDQVVNPLIQAAAVGAAETVINANQAIAPSTSVMEQLQSPRAAAALVSSCFPGAPYPVPDPMTPASMLPQLPLPPGADAFVFDNGLRVPINFNDYFGTLAVINGGEGHVAAVINSAGGVLCGSLPAPSPLPPPPPPPPPPPDQTLWYCGLRADGTKHTLSSVGPLSPAIAAQFVAVVGPYADSITAANSCPAVVGQPPPVTQPPPEPQYFCVRQKLPDGTYSYAVYPADNVLQLATAGFEYVAGPFAARADADKACQDATSLITYEPVTSCVLPKLPNWCDPNVCDTLSALQASLTTDKEHPIWDLLGGLKRDASGKVTGGGWFYSITSWLPDQVEAGVYYAVDVIDACLSTYAKSAGTAAAGYLTLIATNVALNVANKFLGAVPPDLLRTVDYWRNEILPVIPPSVGEADMAYVRGFISEKQWECWVRANNVCPEPHKIVLQAAYTRPGWREAERLYRTGYISNDTRQDYYVKSGIGNDDERGYFESLYTQYPGMGDIISFMVRDVFDPNVVRDNQLALEFPEKYTQEAAKLGNIAGLTPDIARLYWMAHWQYPSIQSLYTMMHRLRPGVVDPKLVVTQADVAKQLGIADMAPAWRDKLVAISYISISIRQARQLYQNGVIDEQGVEAIYLDQGYYPDQAAKAARNETIVKSRQRAQAYHGWTVSAIASAFAMGAMDANEVNERMQGQGFDLAEAEQMMRRARIDRAGKIQMRAQSKAISSSWAAILNAYKVGSVDQATAADLLMRHGWSMESIQIALAAEDVKSRQAVVAQALTVARRSYLTGEIDEASLYNLLALIGVAEPRIAEYVTTWRLQLTPRRKTLAGLQVLRLFGEGLLSEDDSRQRLNRLGWSDPDLSLLVLEARNKREQAVARSLKAADQSRIKAASLVAKEVKAQQALVKETQNKLCHMVPVSRLVKWFARHWIELPYLEERLVTCGYTRDVIDGYLLEALDAREKEDKRAEKAIDKLRSAPRSSTANGAGSAGTANPGSADG